MDLFSATLTNSDTPIESHTLQSLFKTLDFPPRKRIRTGGGGERLVSISSPAFSPVISTLWHSVSQCDKRWQGRQSADVKKKTREKSRQATVTMKSWRNGIISDLLGENTSMYNSQSGRGRRTTTTTTTTTTALDCKTLAHWSLHYGISTTICRQTSLKNSSTAISM